MDAFVNSFIFQTIELIYFSLSCFHLVSHAIHLEIKGQEVEEQFLSTRPPDPQSAGEGAPYTLPTIPGNRIQLESTAAPQPAKIPPSETRETLK